MKVVEQRYGARALVIIGAILSVMALGVATAAAATTLGNAQSQAGLNCNFDGSLIQQTSSGPSYTVPTAGSLTDWSMQEGDFPATVALEVWRPAGGGQFSLVFQSPSISLPAGNAVITTKLSPAAAVNAGDVLGFHSPDSPAPSPCLYTGNAPDDVGAAFGSSPPFTPLSLFPISIFGFHGVNIAATFIPMQAVAGNSRAANPNNNITATVGVNGVPSGATVDVSVATGTFAGPVSCHDTESNTYTVVADRNTGNGRLFVCSSVLSAGLSSGDVITAMYPGFSGLSVVSVTAISASASTGVTDGVSTSFGSNPPVSSGNITTSHAADALFGVAAHSSPSTFTATSGFTVVGEVSGGSGAGQRTVSPMFNSVTSTGVYSATGTLSGSGFWQAAIVAYQSP
jgi:hypothetical protein